MKLQTDLSPWRMHWTFPANMKNSQNINPTGSFDDINKDEKFPKCGKVMTYLFWDREGRGKKRSSLESHYHLQSKAPQPL
jgi:hypothetical protein